MARHLALLNSEFRSCTDFLYKGLRFVNGAYLTISNSRFYDAKKAINIIGNCIGRISNSHFECNRVGISLNSATTIGISDNVFKCPVGIKADETLPFNPNKVRAHAGIEATNNSHVIASSNYFQQLYYGIIIIKSTIAASGNEFRYMIIKTYGQQTYGSGDGGYCVYSS
ncbi:MAG: hypothetical protein HOP11_15730 [Saprospiraceae bacterium]|nr:hypothetical protein [Saprospiraceae bacterium]